MYTYYSKQECIPVGCVPAAYRPYAGFCFRGGLPGPGGCLPGLGGAAWSGLGGVCLVWGVCLLGEVCLVWGGSGIQACTEADTLPPCGQTHTCKNITLATTSLRPVNMCGSAPAQIHAYATFIVGLLLQKFEINFDQRRWSSKRKNQCRKHHRN